MQTDGHRRDMMYLIGAFRDCTNAPSNENLDRINPTKPSDTFNFNTQITGFFFSPHNTFACP